MDPLAALSLATSKLKTDVVVPTRPPTLTQTRLLTPAPVLIRHRADVSDIQLDRSHADRPLDTDVVRDSSPSPAPITVTLPDPVAAVFDIVALLRLASWIEAPPVKLPICPPAVAATRRVPPACPPALTLTALSDSQPVLSELVRPPRTSCEAECAPNPEPATVRLQHPVDAALARSIPLPATPSPENALVWLLDTLPAVTAIPVEPTRPTCPLLHLMVVSASHAVLSHAVIHMTTPCVRLPTPKLIPCTVTLTDPEAAALGLLAVLIHPGPDDSMAVHVPARWPMVTACRTLPCPPDARRQTTHVSEAHRVCSHPVMPPEADSECDRSPRLEPCRVRLEAPVTCVLLVRTALIPRRSLVNASDALPAQRPEVTATRRLPGDPTPAFTAKAVSDSHELCSHTDHPADPANVAARKPMCAPCTVTLVAPEAGAFRRPTRLALTGSDVKPSETLPT